MRALGVIPARYASTRFPGKPLADLEGRPIVQWVHDAAAGAGVFDEVVVATDDDRIARCVESFGGVVELTGDGHETGTDRVAEVAARHVDADVVANVQGDQPFVTADMLAALLAPYVAGRRPDMTTLGCPLGDEQVDDPNAVKVLVDQQQRALYFSRAAVPYTRTKVRTPTLHHLGLYAFTAEFLACYHTLAPTPYERCEGLEQLRVLEHGFAIEVAQVDRSVIEVNTPADLEAARAHVRGARSA